MEVSKIIENVEVGMESEIRTKMLDCNPDTVNAVIELLKTFAERIKEGIEHEQS